MPGAEIRTYLNPGTTSPWIACDLAVNALDRRPSPPSPGCLPRFSSACPLRHECHARRRVFPVSMRSLGSRMVARVVVRLPVSSSAHRSRTSPFTTTRRLAAVIRGKSAVIGPPKLPSFRAKSPQTRLTEFTNYRGRIPSVPWAGTGHRSRNPFTQPVTYRLPRWGIATNAQTR